MLTSDIEKIVLASEEGKKLVDIAAVMYMAMREKNVPDIGVQFHTVTPLKINVEAPCFKQP